MGRESLGNAQTISIAKDSRDAILAKLGVALLVGGFLAAAATLIFDHGSLRSASIILTIIGALILAGAAEHSRRAS